MITTIDSQETSKFAELSSMWWDKDGPLKTLHDINAPRLNFIERHVNLKDAKVLDVGCGGGILAESMALKGASVTGLDVEPAVIEAACSHTKQSEVNIHYVCEAIEVFQSEPFDVITCMEMLEHVADVEAVIHHCVRLLNPQGTLFLSTINRTPKAYLKVILGAEYLLNILPKQTHDYKKFIKPSELSRLTRAHGLQTIGLSGIAYNPFTRIATLQPSVDANYLICCKK